MIDLQKSAKNHCEKFNILGAQDIFFCFNGNYSMYMHFQSPTGACHPYLDKIYALMWDNQFICCYCNCTALKLEANNVNKY